MRGELTLCVSMGVPLRRPKPPPPVAIWASIPSSNLQVRGVLQVRDVRRSPEGPVDTGQTVTIARRSSAMPTRTNSSAARARASSSPATAGNGATTDCPEAVVLAGLIEALEGLARARAADELVLVGM